LIKSPEHIHTYRLTPLSIWNACAAGIATAEIVQTLQEFSKYDVPQHVAVEIREYGRALWAAAAGADEAGLVLRAADQPLAEEISRNKHVAPLLAARLSPTAFRVEAIAAGESSRPW